MPASSIAANLSQVATEMSADPCRACGQRTTGRVWRIFDHEYNLGFRAHYHECACCGTLSQMPMPDLKRLSTFYPWNYHSFSNADLLMRTRTAMRVARLRSVIGKTRGAVLDYGCGNGMFLMAAARRMPERKFFGYEIAETNSVETYMDGRVTIYRGNSSTIFANLPPLAVACLNHVIEHLPEPLSVLMEIKERLVPGGAIDGQTPRADSLERKVFGSFWAGFHAPRHTIVFSRDGIKRIFERSGFDKINVTDAFNPGGIAISLGSALQGARAGTIRRSGVKWLMLVATATLLAPIDLLSRRAGIMNFCVR